jgi:hypothetical protein
LYNNQKTKEIYGLLVRGDSTRVTISCGGCHQNTVHSFSLSPYLDPDGANMPVLLRIVPNNGILKIRFANYPKSRYSANEAQKQEQISCVTILTFNL